MFFRIYSFYIVFDDLFLNWFSTRVSDDRKYVCDRRLYARVYNYKKIQGASIQEKLHRSRRWKTWWEHGVSFQSSPKINRVLITRLICIQWKSRWRSKFCPFFFSTTEVKDNSSNIHSIIRVIFIWWFEQYSFDDSNKIHSIIHVAYLPY